METTFSNVRWSDLWEVYCPDADSNELIECDWLQSSPIWSSEITSPVDVCDWIGKLYSIHVSNQHRKVYGQYFTPPAVARFMARLSSPLESHSVVVDPGSGVGILLAALAETLVNRKECPSWSAIAYESDPALAPALKLALGYIRYWLKQHAIDFRYEIKQDDFILANANLLLPAPLLGCADNEFPPHLIISNPPYFKILKSDPRVDLLPDIIYGQPNIYSLFMMAAAKLLRPDGQMIFITPRSFCSGHYFQRFRKRFFQLVSLQHLHLFESRKSVFSQDNVLQENVIFSALKAIPLEELVEISNSQGVDDINTAICRSVPLSEVVDVTTEDSVVHLPLDDSDNEIREIFSQWTSRLNSFGIQVSTGPIVPFRTSALVDNDAPESVPVLWIQHIGRMAVTWPLLKFPKQQKIKAASATYNLLLPNSNFVFLRRFSAKEENSRIVAAPYLKGHIPSEFLGVENHVNYLHRPNGILSEAETLGLAAFLNSLWVEHYFRISSSNTQVNATELRNLPLPALGKIEDIGKRLASSDEVSHIALINQIVGEELGLLKVTRTNGGHMTKIEEAKDLLNGLGLPPAQRNELAALTLLALGGITEPDLWRQAQRRSIRIHDMISFIEQNYHKRYAENTRETFRRHVLHQFEQARIVDRNPDDPTLPTNSPRTHYALSESVLPVVQSYGTKAGQKRLEKFRTDQGTLVEIYQQQRAKHLIPLKDSTGQAYRLSPGRHNELQVAVIERFAPRFAHGAKILYLGDTANKTLIMDVEGLKKLGFPVDKHGKLPDIVLSLPKKKWLYLIEVVTSHGPVSKKRYRELETMLAKSPSARVYVSVFPDFKEYLRHARDIAWETEIWIADVPEHLIHYNGDKFIGPHQESKRRTK